MLDECPHPLRRLAAQLWREPLMRSRRLPGQRQPGQPSPGVRPSPPPEPGPLPAEVYFDTQARRKAEMNAAAERETMEVEDQDFEFPGFQNIAREYGARMMAVSGLLLQIAVGMLMLPRIVNAAENLLVNPTQLITLAGLGVVEVTLAGWAFWTRSWFGAVASVGLGIVWWIYLVAQIA